MAQRGTFIPGEYYHLYNRGTEKRDIFTRTEDYKRFLALLYLCNGTIPVDLKLQGRTLYEVANVTKGEPIIDICAYVLMPNHFHIYVREKTVGGISAFMRKLGTGYTMYFNVLYERSGALFQGKFKSRHIRKENYAHYLFAYMHLNPVKLIEPKWKETGIVDVKRAEHYIRQYPYSSFPDFAGEQRPEKIILSPESLPMGFGQKDFGLIASDCLDYIRLQGPTL